MRKIKFRGKSKYSDKIIFGDLNHSSDGESIFVDDEVVYPETVAQLVGYDADGNEVYEGDELVSTINNDYYIVSAYFDAFPEQDDITQPHCFTDFKLKK